MCRHVISSHQLRLAVFSPLFSWFYNVLYIPKWCRISSTNSTIFMALNALRRSLSCSHGANAEPRTEVLSKVTTLSDPNSATRVANVILDIENG